MPAETSPLIQQINAIFLNILNSLGYQNKTSSPIYGSAASTTIFPGSNGPESCTTADIGQISNSPNSKYINKNTLFSIGSITKCVVAWLLIDQIENSQGKSSLDDPLSQYLPVFCEKNPKWGSVTLKQLLNMSSGIPDYLTEDFQAYTKDPNKVWTLADIILSMPKSQLGELNFTPGSEYDYSNTNYILLGLVLQAMTGKPAKELIANFAQQKLGLNPDEFFYAEDFITNPNYANPTASNGVNVAKIVNPSILGTAGGIVATSTAIMKLMEWMYDETKNPHLQTMLSIMISTTNAEPMPNGPTTENPWGYAAGLIQGLLPGLGLVSLYSGEIDGSTAEYQRLMTNLGVFIAAYAINTEYNNLPSFVDIINPILKARGADPVTDADKVKIDALIAEMRAKIKPLKVLSPKPAAAPTPQPAAAGKSIVEENNSRLNGYLNYVVDITSYAASELSNIFCCGSARKNIQEKIDDVTSHLKSPKP